MSEEPQICPNCGRQLLMKDRFGEMSCFNVNCKEDHAKRLKALGKRIRLQVKGGNSFL